MPLPRPQGALLSLHQPHILDALRLVCMGPGESESRLSRPCPGSTAPTHTLPATHLHTQLWCPPHKLWPGPFPVPGHRSWGPWELPVRTKQVRKLTQTGANRKKIWGRGLWGGAGTSELPHCFVLS